jgi:hypothetical protein
LVLSVPSVLHAEAAVVGTRRISLPALCATGDVGLIEQFSLLGGANNKSFDAAVPSAALAAGRVVLEFVAGPVEKPVVDTSAAWIDAKGKIVRSTTGQLAWDHSDREFITVDTPGTKAVIGHCGGKAHALGEVTSAPKTPFCHVSVTAPGTEGPCRVFALDHGGRKTDPPVDVPVEQTADGCRIVLDGAKHRTPYYAVGFGTR